jgi:N-acetylglucosaminyldiphosphoundecaprenol N-acetyl-beta-D-mannosaminyltransferase
MPRQRDFAGIKVSPLRRADVLAELDRANRQPGVVTVTFLNPDYARRALLGPQLRADINRFDLVLVDGNGVRLLTPLFGFTVPERLDTDSLAPDVFGRLAQRAGRVFLFGCAPGVAERAALNLTVAFPGLVVAGVDHGYYDVERGHPGRFADEDSVRIVNDVNEAQVDLLVVSLPTPLQQRWVAEHAAGIGAGVIMTAGSYLDHLAEPDLVVGTWYPRWAEVLRLNWFYRLVREPRRLWRRYTIEIASFVALVLRQRFTRRA